MTLIIDAAPLVALMNRGNPDYASVERVLASESGELIVPAAVTAEVDFLERSRYDRHAARAFLRELASIHFCVECLEPDDYPSILLYDLTYSDLDVGLADISVVILAHRYRRNRILTFDQRHFRVLRPIDGGHFTILPADEQGP